MSKKGLNEEESSGIKSTLQEGFKNIVSLSKAIFTEENENPVIADFNFTDYAKNYRLFLIRSTHHSLRLNQNLTTDCHLIQLNEYETAPYIF